MAKVTRPCPNCQYPLAIPQPPPERFMCPKCKVIMKRKGDGIAMESPPAAAQPAKPQQQIRAQPPAPKPPAARPAPAPNIRAGVPVPARAAAPAAARPSGAGSKKPLLILGGVITLLVVGIALVLVLLLGGGPKDPAQTKGGPRDGNGGNANQPVGPQFRRSREDDEEKVKTNIEKGVKFLTERLGEKMAKDVRPWGDDWERNLTHSPAGVASLIGLTLLECGLAGDAPEIVFVSELIEKEAANLQQTYLLSTAVLFLCRWHEALPKGLEDRHKRLVETFALRLINAQLNYGGWLYDAPAITPAQQTQLLKELTGGTFKPDKAGNGTTSNTHFAMQALWNARKFGVPVRASLLAAAANFERTQAGDGSWSYAAAAKDRFLASSTCSALVALAMEKALLDKDQRPFVPNEASANLDLAWKFLGRHIGDKAEKAKHDMADVYSGHIFKADAWGDIYFLWAVQRVGTIYDLDAIADKDWYGWGYPLLLERQQENGSWADQHGPLVDTCFALLFLKRADLAKDLTAKLKEMK